MAARRTDMHRLQELIRLCRQGLRDRAIGRALKMGRDTVRAYRHAFSRAALLDGPVDELPDGSVLEAALKRELPPRPLPPLSSSIESFRPHVAELFKRGAGPKAIFDRLRVVHPDFPGSLSAIKRMCRRLRLERGVSPEDVAIRVETEPGEVAYVDFGYAGLRYDQERGVLRKSWVFVMVLGYSRHMVAYLVFDQKVSTWLSLHVRAFEELGGVPRMIVPDNLKAAVVRAAFGIDDEPLLHRSYRELARHFGFRVEPTRPRTPEHKGKVESGVKYVKKSFLAALDSVDLVRDDQALKVWLRDVAGKRVHGTTARVPAAAFAEEERATLLPLPKTRYELVLWKRAKLHRDSHVQIDGAFYSAPWPLLHQELWARTSAHEIVLFHEDRRVAWHHRVGRGLRSTVKEHLPDHRVDLRERSRSYWEKKAAEIGPSTHDLVVKIFDQDDVLSRLRPVQAIVTHLSSFPRERAEAAARRALHFGSTTYAALKNILRRGLDLEPLPTASTRPWLKHARFARSVSEIASAVKSPSLWEIVHEGGE